MSKSVDIDSVLAQSTSNVPVSELSRKGFKNVKVLNQRTIGRLIEEAVDRVVAAREEEITTEERARFFQQSREEFEKLIRERLSRERERQEEFAREKVEETVRLRSELKSREGALREARAFIEQQDLRIKQLEARLSGEQESAPPQNDLQTVFRALIHEIRSDRKGSQDSEVGELKKTIEGLAETISQKLASVAPGYGGPGGGPVSKDVILDALFNLDDDDQSLETNVKDVNVKEAKASGVKSTLAKLKSLQKGGSDDS